MHARRPPKSPEKVAGISADQPDFDALVTILRDVTRSPTNAVMYELMVAARTDEKLRDTLRKVLTEFGSEIYESDAACRDARRCRRRLSVSSS